MFHQKYRLILSKIQRNWFALSFNARRARKVLQFNFEESWTVLIHNSNKIPSYLHFHQVNYFQGAYIKNVLLLKVGRYFFVMKKKAFLLLNSDRKWIGQKYLTRFYEWKVQETILFFYLYFIWLLESWKPQRILEK